MTAPLFAPTADGEAYTIQPAGVLLLIGSYAYDKKEPQSVRDRCRFFVSELLAAAHVGGYKQTDILETLLATECGSARCKSMARAACDAIDPDTLQKIFDKMREKR